MTGSSLVGYKLALALSALSVIGELFVISILV